MEGKKSPIFERRANVSLKAKVDSLEATFINMRKSIVDDIKREIRGELLEGTQNIEEYDSEALSKENRLFTKMQAEIKEEVLNELKTEIAQNLKVELRQCLLEQNFRMFIFIICCSPLTHLLQLLFRCCSGTFQILFGYFSCTYLIRIS